MKKANQHQYQYQQALNWRRDRVRELTIKGWSQRDIATELKIDVAMINRDLKFMRQQAKNNIQHYIDEFLPAEYQYCLDALSMIVKEMWNVKPEDTRAFIQARMVIKECLAMRIDLLSNSMVVSRAIQFVDRHRDLIQIQQPELTDNNNSDDTPKPE